MSGLPSRASAVQRIDDQDRDICGVESRDARLWQIDLSGTLIGKVPGTEGAASFPLVNVVLRWSLGSRRYEQRLDTMPAGIVRVQAESVTVSVGVDLHRVARLATITGTWVPFEGATIAASISPVCGGGGARIWYADPVVPVNGTDTAASEHLVPVLPSILQARLFSPSDAAIGGVISGQGRFGDLKSSWPVWTCQGTGQGWPSGTANINGAYGPIPFCTVFRLSSTLAWIAGGGSQRWLLWAMDT